MDTSRNLHSLLSVLGVTLVEYTILQEVDLHG